MARPVFARPKRPAGGGNLGKSDKTQNKPGTGGMNAMQWSGMEWIDGMQCSRVEWNECILVILGHFDTCGSKFGLFCLKT